MQKELPKAYEPQKYEDKIYKKWEESGFFNPDICIKNNICKEDAETFSIVLPPPNVTGNLHMGHAAMLAIQDVLIRYNRMQAKRTLWLPGTDHAAVATESKVENILIKEKGYKKPKQELGKEKFLKEVTNFAKKSHDTIINQTKKMGASLDWSRETYTLDEKRHKAVYTVFKKMYDDGLIYRGFRVINWSVKGQSTCSDDELVYKERQGKIYTFKYSEDFPIEIATTRPETKLGDTAVAVHPKDKRYKKFIGKIFEVKNFADSGVNLKIKIIANENVDMEYGTGAVGVTPAHSSVDFDMYMNQKALKDEIEMIQVIDKNGKMTEVTGKYTGLEVLDCRKKVVEALKKNNLFIKEEDTIQNVGTSDRFGDVVEAIPMTQWFIDVNKKFKFEGKKLKNIKNGGDYSLKELMQTVVKSGQIKIIPGQFEKVYFNWIDNLRDWCISRQIWFGHQIPVWYKSNSKVWKFGIGKRELFDKIKSGKKIFEIRVGRERSEVEKNWEDLKVNDTIDFLSTVGEGGEIIESGLKKNIKKIYHFSSVDEMFKNNYIKENIDASEKEYREYLEKRFEERMKKFGIYVFELENTKEVEEEIYVGIEAPEGDDWVQDTDTLDTWFSSGLWTFSTLGYPDLEVKDLKDFHPTSVMETGYDILFFWVARMILMTTYTLGDIPFETVYLHGLVRDEKGKKMSKSLGNTIDPLQMIEKYGADATRLSLLIGNTPGNDMKLSEEKIAGFRNFTNKLWNISRFMLLNIDNPKIDIELPKAKTLSDKWILDELSVVVMEYNNLMSSFNLSLIGEKLRDFTWNELADWYLEIAKVEGDKSEILNYILNIILKLWHPFMPFVTEEIWAEIYGEDKNLMIEKFPSSFEYSVSGKAVEGSKNRLEFKIIKNIIIGIRSVRAENKVEPAKKLNIIISADDKKDLLEENKEVIKFLARLDKIEIFGKQEKPEKYTAFVESGVEVFVDLLANLDVEKEISRIEKEIEKVKPFVKSLETKLNNKSFVDNAPEKVVEIEKNKLREAQDKLNKLQKQLENLK